MKGNKIALVTSGQPALNPRLVKEADALCEAGYDVVVFYSYWNDWGTAADQIIFPKKIWRAVRVGGHPEEDRLRYQLSRVVQKIARMVYRITGSGFFGALGVARGSFFLKKALKSYHADLYIGHNLGALPAIVAAAKKHHKPCGFDAEDFYRYDQSDDKESWEVRLKINIEDHYLPKVHYITAASPGISSAYKEVYPDLQPVTLLNVFMFEPKLKPVPRPARDKIKLFWFSQTIGKERGIEMVFEALRLLKTNSFEIHLLGNCDPEFKRILINRDQPVFFYDPVAPDDLPRFAAQFDIGLASELHLPFNRDICLTNKIFTYMQAGLAVVASNTTAQKALLTNYPAIGAVYEIGLPATLSGILKHYEQHPELIDHARRESFSLSKSHFNWQQEKRSFIALIKQNIDKFE